MRTTHAPQQRPSTSPLGRRVPLACSLTSSYNTLSSLAEGRAYGVRVRWKIRGITEFKPSRNGSDQTIRTSFSANFAPGAWHLLPSPLAPGISCATAARHPSDPSACEPSDAAPPSDGTGRGARAWCGSRRAGSKFCGNGSRCRCNMEEKGDSDGVARSGRADTDGVGGGSSLGGGRCLGVHPSLRGLLQR